MRAFPFLAALATFMLVNCASDNPETDKEAAPTFDQSVYRYCLAVDAAWLRDQMERVEQAWPSEFEFGSLSYERMHASNHALGETVDRSRKELMVRYSAVRNGQEIALFTLAEIDPETCAISNMEASVGRDRYEDRGNQGFDVP